LSTASGAVYASDTAKIAQGAHDYILLGCGIAPEKSDRMLLTVSGAAGCVLNSIEVAATGSELEFEAEKSSLRVVWGADGKSAVTYMQGRRACYTLDKAAFVFYDDADDFMALPGGSMFVRRRGKALDILNSGWGLKYAVSASASRFSAAYCPGDGAYYVAYIENGAAYFCEFTLFYITMPIPVRLPFVPVSCLAVAGADPPAFIFRDANGTGWLKAADSAPPVIETRNVKGKIEYLDI